MNLDRVEKIAEAVLYEGYMLYPYRPSSVKNQQRWNFGVLYPPSWCDAQFSSDRCSMQTECLLKTDSSTRPHRQGPLPAHRAALHRKAHHAIGEPPGESDLELVDRLELAGRVYQPWQEAVERELSYGDLDPADFCTMSPLLFSFPAGKRSRVSPR